MNKKAHLNGLRLLVIAVTLAAGGNLVHAEDATEGQILRALTPTQPLTRSLSMTPPADSTPSAESRFVDSLRNRPTRSLSLGERQQITTIAKDKPKIDLEINFNYNSATISRAARPSVEALGKALSNPDLKGSTFLVAGHTDAIGSEAYNQNLSERRADAIKKYLVDKFGIAGSNLVTVGYGKSQLKKPEAPNDPANRRVQVVNMVSQTASK